MNYDRESLLVIARKYGLKTHLISNPFFSDFYIDQNVFQEGAKCHGYICNPSIGSGNYERIYNYLAGYLSLDIIPNFRAFIEEVLIEMRIEDRRKIEDALTFEDWEEED